MKTPLLVLIITAILIVRTDAQNPPFKKNADYNVWIEQINNTKSSKGFLTHMNDEGVIFLKNDQYKSWLADPSLTQQFIPSEQIDVMKFRKKGKLMKGTLIGGLAGGLGLGLMILADESCSGFGCASYGGEGFLVGFILGALPGMGIGAAASGAKVTIPLNGNYKKYKANKVVIDKYLLEAHSIKN